MPNFVSLIYYVVPAVGSRKMQDQMSKKSKLAMNTNKQCLHVYFLLLIFISNLYEIGVSECVGNAEVVVACGGKNCLNSMYGRCRPNMPEFFWGRRNIHRGRKNYYWGGKSVECGVLFV